MAIEYVFWTPIVSDSVRWIQLCDQKNLTFVDC